MFGNLYRILIVVILALSASSIAADGKRSEIQTTTRLRVCSDPGNLPFSHKDKRGFENEIIDLLAHELNLKVDYVWFPQTIGFVRNTLRVRRCDLISGISTSSELVQNTNPYYRSTYVLVYRVDSGLSANTIYDDELRGLRFGVVAGTPPATILTELGDIDNTKPYHLMVDTRHFAPIEEAVKDVQDGEIDVAVVWGPSAGYYVAQYPELALVPITTLGGATPTPYNKLDYRISMAVRYGESEWKRRINRALKELQPQITEILVRYHVPLLDDQGDIIE